MLLETTAEAATDYAVSTHGETQPLPQWVHSFCWSTDLFLLERNCILSTKDSKLGDAWRIWAGGRDLDYSFAESKALTCWEDGQPWHTRPALAVPDKVSVLQKPPVTVGFSSKGQR